MSKSLISLSLSAFNEGSIIEGKLSTLTDYMHSLEDEYNWEIILVNDGSSDDTGARVESFAKKHPNIKVFHHKKNLGLGKGLQTAFKHSKGDYVVTYDVDLSTSPEYIRKLLDKIITTKAKIVIASPTLTGGKMSGIPWHRHLLSVSANKFLSHCSSENISSLTSMTRVYDGEFIRNLNLRSTGMEIMPEIVYKTMILKEKIEEIPSSLVWNMEENKRLNRVSNMKILNHTIQTLFTGFLLKPIFFFLLPGLILFFLSLYSITSISVHFFHEYAAADGNSWLNRFSLGLENAYKFHPHIFILAFFSTLFFFQIILTGLQSLQNKYYFEELYYLITNKSRKAK